MKNSGPIIPTGVLYKILKHNKLIFVEFVYICNMTKLQGRYSVHKNTLTQTQE